MRCHNAQASPSNLQVATTNFEGLKLLGHDLQVGFLRTDMSTPSIYKNTVIRIKIYKHAKIKPQTHTNIITRHAHTHKQTYLKLQIHMQLHADKGMYTHMFLQPCINMRINKHKSAQEKQTNSPSKQLRLQAIS